MTSGFPTKVFLSIIFILSTFSSYNLYTTIRSSKEKNYFFADRFKLGNRNFFLLSNNQQIGSFNEELTIDQGFFDYKNEGTMKAKILGQVQTISFSTNLVFNEIDQLGAGLFKIKTEDKDFVIGCKEIDPIKIKVKLPFSLPDNLATLLGKFSKNAAAVSPKLSVENLTTIFEFSIPGPISLLKTSDPANSNPTLSKQAGYGLYWDYFTDLNLTASIPSLKAPNISQFGNIDFSVLTNLRNKIESLNFRIAEKNQVKTIPLDGIVDIDLLLSL